MGFPIQREPDNSAKRVAEVIGGCDLPRKMRRGFPDLIMPSLTLCLNPFRSYGRSQLRTPKFWPMRDLKGKHCTKQISFFSYAKQIDLCTCLLDFKNDIQTRL